MRGASHHPELNSFLSTETLEKEGEIVSIYVEFNHPLLQLKRALPWKAIQEVMVRRWRAAGKNVDGRPRQSWDFSLYVPIMVLMCVKHFNSREMEECTCRRMW